MASSSCSGRAAWPTPGRSGLSPGCWRSIHDVADGRAAPDPAPAAVVVGIEGDDAGHPAAVPGGQAEPDRRSDGLADHDGVGHADVVQECLDRIGEVGGGVVSRRGAGVAVAGQVDGDQFDAGIAQLGADGVEVFELHAQRVQQHDGPPVAASAIAHGGPIDLGHGRAAGGRPCHRISSDTALGASHCGQWDAPSTRWRSALPNRLARWAARPGLR